jgi:hypothetical protein
MLRKYALPIARVLAIWIGVARSLFGQVFVGDFSIGATLAGVGAVSAGALSWGPRPTAVRLLIVGTCCVTSLVGTAIEAITYYREMNIPGNNFGWPMRGPFVAAVMLIGYDAFAAMRRAPAVKKQ